MTSFPPPEDTVRITSVLHRHLRWSVFWDKKYRVGAPPKTTPTPT